MGRTCKRCGKPIRQSEHSTVVYCSEKCSCPTEEDFRKWKDRGASRAGEDR